MNSRKQALVCVNRDFVETKRYPRHRKKFADTLGLLDKDGVGYKVLPVEFAGEDSHSVIDNIAHQLRSHMASFYDGTTITLLGDSGACSFLQATRKNVKDHPVISDKDLNPNPILVGPCGTMEALARTMQMDTAERVAGVLRGDIPHDVQDIFVRQVKMDVFEGEKLIRSKTSDWLLFCGTGLDGEIIEKQETKPRTRSAKFNIAHTGVETIRSIMDKTRAPIFVDSVMTIPFYGYFNLDKEKYNLLDNKCFYNIAFEAERGWTALPRLLVFNAMGVDSRISNALWDDLYGLHEIPDSIKPRFLATHKVNIRPDDQCIHIDSYPEHLHLEESQRAELTFSTTDEIVQVVKAVV